jgi:hypothetical protein
MRKPADGRPFILSNQLPDKLIARYQRWTWVHVIIVCAAAGAAFALI